eukprot:scaffold363_cov56-Cylindrotheca_fusiformis.AAC.35
MGPHETSHVFQCEFDLKDDKPVKLATMGYPNDKNHIATDWKNRQIQPLKQLECDQQALLVWDLVVS